MTIDSEKFYDQNKTGLWDRETLGWGIINIRCSGKASLVMRDFSSELNTENEPDMLNACAEGMDTKSKDSQAL